MVRMRYGSVGAMMHGIAATAVATDGWKYLQQRRAQTDLNPCILCFWRPPGTEDGFSSTAALLTTGGHRSGQARVVTGAASGTAPEGRPLRAQ